MQALPQLERQREDVHPSDLADGDGIGNRERGIQHALCSREDFGERGEVGEGNALGGTVGEGGVADGALDVGGEVGEDFEGEVAELFRAALDGFAGVALREGEVKVLA